MTKSQALYEKVQDRFSGLVENILIAKDGMVTVELSPTHLLEVARALHTEPQFHFETLIDVCGVDYLQYGISSWRTEETTTSGYSRGVEDVDEHQLSTWDKPRFAAVYHLVSLSHNQRIRLRVFVEGNPPLVPSVVSIWSSADWFEREAFDLFGIVFDGHHDLRRILTDYGFVGHPFRKDFPLIGEVELRYDAKQKRCIYEPVSIQPRVLAPKVIRKDNRYLDEESGASK